MRFVNLSITFKMSWRNLWRHKGKSLVIGVILFFGAFLMTVGNGMVSGMEAGLSNNIINLFTGDIVVISNEQEKDDVLFSFSGKPLKTIKNFEAVKEVLDTHTAINTYLPATAGMVYVFNSGSDLGSIMLLGVDFDRYRKVFPDSIVLTEGAIFKTGERGLLVTEEARKQGYEAMNFWTLPVNGELIPEKLPEEAKANIDSLEIKRDIVFMGLSTTNSTPDVRVDVTGIINFKALNKIWGDFCIIDIESFREAHNYVTGADQNIEISEEKRQLLEDDGLDSFFSTESLIDNSLVTDTDLSIETIKTATQRSGRPVNINSGAYNLAFIKLKKGIKPEKALAELNQAFQSKNLNVRAISWKKAMGSIGSMAFLIKIAFNAFIMFIFVVAIIVIVNTLSMAAMERASEIGMMRAIGARKGFLRKMFIYETGVLSFFFGGIGIIAGIIMIYLLQSANVTTADEILQLVFGGEQLNPIFTYKDLLLGLVELLIVTLLAVLYPLRIVGKIVPLDAIARD